MIISPIVLAGWTEGAGTINDIYSHNGFNVITSTLEDNPCGSSGKFYWPITDDNAKDMFAISLAALMAQKKIRVVFDPAKPVGLLGCGKINSYYDIEVVPRK